MADRRAQLIQAASEVMRESGVSAATTRAVTQRAGLPHGAFHYCFNGKDDLLKAILDREIVGALKGAWNEVELDGSSLENTIETALLGFLNYVRADPAQHILIWELSMFAHRTESVRHVIQWEHQQYVERIGGMLNEWSEHMHVPLPVEASKLAGWLIATGSGIASVWLGSRDDHLAEQVIKLAATGVSRVAQPN